MELITHLKLVLFAIIGALATVIMAWLSGKAEEKNNINNENLEGILENVRRSKKIDSDIDYSNRSNDISFLQDNFGEDQK